MIPTGHNSQFSMVHLQIDTCDAALLECSATLPAAVRLHYILCKSGVPIHLSSSHTLIYRAFALESMEWPHEDIFVDGAGCNLPKRRSRGRYINGQHGGNETLCAATGNHGVLCLHPTLGPYNTLHPRFLSGWSSRRIDMACIAGLCHSLRSVFTVRCPGTTEFPYESAIPKCLSSTILPFPPN